MKVINPTPITLVPSASSGTQTVLSSGAWSDTAPWDDNTAWTDGTAGTVVAGTLIASSVPETDYPEWVAGTTYARGTMVMRAALHRVFESAGDGNLGHDPASGAAYWIDAGPTNRWAMLDQAVGTTTDATGSISVTIAPGAVSSLAVLDTNADSVRVAMTVDGTTLYDVTQSTNAGGAAIDNWYAYFTADVGKVVTLIFGDLPRYAQGQLAVTVTGPNPAGIVSIGTLLVGNVIDLGTTETGPNVGITDFSRKVTDDYGITDVVERAWAKKMTLRSMVPTSSVDNIQRRLASLRAKPALWIGEKGYDSLTVYGFFKEFSLDLALSNISYCSLTIEGLI